VTEIEVLLERLGKLLKQGGKRLYERVKTVVEVLKHDEWIEINFGGNDNKAIEWLKKTYFSDTDSTIGKLTAIFAKFPTLKEWEERNFDINLMWAVVYKDLPEPERRHSNGRISAREAVQLKSEVELLKKELELVKKERDLLKQENAALRKHIRELMKESSYVNV